MGSASSRTPSWRLSRPAFCEICYFLGELFGIDGIGVEVVVNPIAEFDVTVVSRVCDGCEELGVSPGAADVFWGAATCGVDQTRI
jgi:hypothetical protein